MWLVPRVMTTTEKEERQSLTCPTGILSPRGEEEVSSESSRFSPQAAKGNFSIAPWGEGVRRTGEGLRPSTLSTVCPTLAGLYIVPYGLMTASNWLSTNRRPMFSAKQEPTNRSLSVAFILKDGLGIFTCNLNSIQ